MIKIVSSQDINSGKVLNNLLWRFLERCGAQLVAFIVSVVLARILFPADYGTVALITVFTAILQVFVDSGLGTALIQKKDADNLDFSTVFFTNIAVCFVLYVMICAAAPLISGFYGKPEMTPLIRVLSLTVLISGVKNVQQAYVSRNMLFKRFFFSTLGGTVTAAVAGIAMAYSGCGVWALVAQQVINTAIDTLILWITVRWRPERKFSFERLQDLFSYGWKLLLSALLDTIYGDIRQLIIGKKYSSVDLAYYNQGEKFPKFIVSNINTSIDSVLLPAMSGVQEQREQVRNMTRRSIQVSIYIMAPLMMGLCFIAEPLVRLVLTEKWIFCVPFLRISCITYMFWPIHTANLNAIKALGRSDLFLRLEVIKKAVGMTVLLVSMWFGVMAMAYSLLLTSVSSQIINSWPNRKLLGYGYLEQLKDILPGIALAVFMGVCVYPFCRLGLPDAVTLGIQVILGAAIYLLGSKLMHVEAFQYLHGMIEMYIRPICNKRARKK